MIGKILSQVYIDPKQLDIPQTGDVGDNTVSTLLSFTFAIGAGIALIIIILAGIQFILSRGDPEKNAKARRTIIYASIGLVLCATAFTLVRFVVGQL